MHAGLELQVRCNKTHKIESLHFVKVCLVVVEFLYVYGPATYSYYLFTITYILLESRRLTGVPRC